MSDTCPSCGRPALGQSAVLLVSRGTHETLPGVGCACGNVWIDHSRPEDEYGEKIEDVLDLDGDSE